MHEATVRTLVSVVNRLDRDAAGMETVIADPATDEESSLSGDELQQHRVNYYEGMLDRRWHIADDLLHFADEAVPA